MTAWRVGVLVLLLTLVGLPLFLPVADLLGHPEAWRAWQETSRLATLSRNTFLLTAFTLALAWPAGVAGAVLLNRTDLPLRRVFLGLTLLTLFVPLPLFASGWQAALGSGGWLPLGVWAAAPASAQAEGAGGPGRLLWTAWGRGFPAAVWIHAVAALPWVILLAGVGLRWVEPDLEADALTAASPARVLLRVSLPRAGAALGAAALWVLLQTTTEIAVTDMFQVRTFAEEVYTQMVSPELAPGAATVDLAVGRAVAVGLPWSLAIAGLVVLAVRQWEASQPGHSPGLARIGPPRLFPLGRWRAPCFALVLTVAVVLAAVPVGSLVWKAGRSYGGPWEGEPGAVWSAGVVAESLGRVAQSRGGLVAGSLVVALAAGAAVASLALVVSWLMRDSRLFPAVVLALLALAWAAPGPVVGLGLKEAIGQVLDMAAARPDGLLARLLYEGPSPVPVLWAYLVRFLAPAVALTWPAVRAMPREWMQAARLEGAGPTGELRWVVWPLGAGAWVRAALAVAVLALGELSAGKLVETPGSQTFAHEVFAQMHYGVTRDLAALCLVLLGAVLAGAGLLLGVDAWLRRRRAGPVRSSSPR